MNTWFVSAFWLSWIMLLQTWVYKYLFESQFAFFEYMPRSGIAKLYSNSMFNFLRNCCTVFHRNCTIILYSHYQCTRVLIDVHPLQCLLFGFVSFFFSFLWFYFFHYNWFTVFCQFLIGISMGVQWCLIKWFDWHSLVISHVHHLVMCFLSICVSSLEKRLFMPSAHILFRLFVFWLLSFWNTLPS